MAAESSLFLEGGSLRRRYDGTERICALLVSVIGREREPPAQSPAAAPSTAVLSPPIFSLLSLSISQVVVTGNPQARYELSMDCPAHDTASIKTPRLLQ